jgi:menaquinone-dependent protoporphyrinogen oxidase
MANIIILYSTTDGHTVKICSHLQQVINGKGHQVSIVSIEDVKSVDFASFDKVVIGASIRYGKHNKKVYAFIKNNEQLLNSKPNAFFSVSVVARKPEKRQPDTNPYVKKFLKEITWKPEKVAVFAGKIAYPRYTFFDRNMIRLIMWMTKGPTDPTSTIEFTDWKQVEEFGQAISDI